MADVWLATATGVSGFQKTVVLKTILPHLAENPEFVRMFINEALLAAVLDHPNIVHIFDLGQFDEAYFIAMEYISGRTLRQIQRELRKSRRRVPPPWFALHVAASVCDALDYAHNKRDEAGRPLGLVHRDITPENIMVAFSGETKVLDFGIAKANAVATSTQAGTLKGKFAYMAPDQIAGAVDRPRADPRFDIYALGVVLYELLTCQRPFGAPNELLLLRKILEETPPRPSSLASWIPKELETIIVRAMDRNPETRFQSAAEMRGAIETYLTARNMYPTARHVGEYMMGLFGVSSDAAPRPAPKSPPTGNGYRPVTAASPELRTASSEVHTPEGSVSVEISVELPADSVDVQFSSDGKDLVDAAPTEKRPPSQTATPAKGAAVDSDASPVKPGPATAASPTAPKTVAKPAAEPPATTAGPSQERGREAPGHPGTTSPPTAIKGRPAKTSAASGAVSAIPPLPPLPASGSASGGVVAIPPLPRLVGASAPPAAVHERPSGPAATPQAKSTAAAEAKLSGAKRKPEGKTAGTAGAPTADAAKGSPTAVRPVILAAPKTDGKTTAPAAATARASGSGPLPKPTTGGSVAAVAVPLPTPVTTGISAISKPAGAAPTTSTPTPPTTTAVTNRQELAASSGPPGAAPGSKPAASSEATPAPSLASLLPKPVTARSSAVIPVALPTPISSGAIPATLPTPISSGAIPAALPTPISSGAIPAALPTPISSGATVGEATKRADTPGDRSKPPGEARPPAATATSSERTAARSASHAWDLLMERARRSREAELEATRPEPPAMADEAIDAPGRTPSAPGESAANPWDRLVDRARKAAEEERRADEAPRQPSGGRASTTDIWSRREHDASEHAEQGRGRMRRRAPSAELRSSQLFDEGLERLRAGDREAALRVWTAALEIDPDNRMIQGNLRTLKKLMSEGSGKG